MKWFALLCVLACATPALAQGPASGPTSGAAPGATATSMTPSPDDRAKQWLTLLDDANYTDAYAQMSSAAKGKTAMPAWQNRLVTTRQSLGAMASRNIKDVKLTKVRPGMSDGQSATVRFDSGFAKKAAAVESVTLISEKGGWSVTDYSIQ